MIAESRLAWQKFDEEMKKMDQISYSRLGQNNNIEVEHTSNNSNLVGVEKQDEKPNVSNESSQERIIKTEIEKKGDSTGSPNSNCTIPEPDIQASHIQRPWFSPMKLVRFPSLVGGNV